MTNTSVVKVTRQAECESMFMSENQLGEREKTELQLPAMSLLNLPSLAVSK